MTERRLRLQQARASPRIEGHQPSAEFLADMLALITGQIDAEEVQRRIIERAWKADRRAMNTTVER
ncbi:antitoxin VbhA family protein [Mitsuaria sp. WAJ17]|uniref:antitoxin VbhA family protein n=1 Tax=Mitsuaria sp. WAJ17 TaxID=2761452 RepID=UPI00160253B3|nr:antitoxin VbhA family protein [Mitsuaria sp. WAJ17]MBB2487503.1 antitoxin VbhA family protein [Mitsuaria sp. WAJ17]